MRDTRARQLLVADARRLDLLHDAITGDITAGQIEADGPAASDTHGPTAAALTLEHEVEASLRVAIADERAEVAFALARLDAGTYGACGACGETIPDARLAVVPATRFCIGCEVTGERGARAEDLLLVDTILRAALREVDAWDDDGPDEDDVVVPAPEEAAMHDVAASGRA